MATLEAILQNLANMHAGLDSAVHGIQFNVERLMVVGLQEIQSGDGLGVKSLEHIGTALGYTINAFRELFVLEGILKDILALAGGDDLEHLRAWLRAAAKKHT